MINFTMNKFKLGQIVKINNHPTCKIKIKFVVGNINLDGSTFIYTDNGKCIYTVKPKYCRLIKDT